MITVDATSSGVCTIATGIVTFNHVGTCRINANQAGTSDYNPAPQSQQALTVNKADQAIAFTTSAPNPVYGDASTYTPTATGGNSGNPRTFTIDPTSSGICTATTGTITFQHAGTCSVNANQTGTSDYNPAPQTQQTITVDKAAQTVSFLSGPPSPVYGDEASYTPVTLGGSSSSPRLTTIDASSSGVCAIDWLGAITFLNAGTCVANLDRAGDADHDAAPRVQQMITVAKAPQIVVFTTAVPEPTFGDGAIYVPAAAGGASGNAVVFSVSSDVCAIDGGRVTFTHGGICTITATQAGTPNYSAAEPVTQAVRILPAAQSVAITSSAPIGAVIGGDAYTPTTSGSDRGTPVAITAAGACAMRDSRIVPVAVGTCSVTATRPASRDFTAAEATQDYTVGAPPVSTSARVAAAPNAAGRATVTGAQVSWPARAFAGQVAVVLTTSTATASFAAGTTPVRLRIRDASGQPVTSFRRPLEIVFAPGSGTPGYSRNGRSWTAIPRIPGPTLPTGFPDGWFRAGDGSIHVLTMHATDFGVLKRGQKLQAALTTTVRAPRVVNLQSASGFEIVVTTSLPATSVIALQAPGGERIEVRRLRTARPTPVVIGIPTGMRSPGTYTLIVHSKAGGWSAVRRVPVRLIAAEADGVTG